MKNMLKILIGSILISLLGIAVMAQAPGTMMYQGRLTDAAGNPMFGTVDDVIFTIYDDTSSSKVAIWSEVLPLTCNEQGIFTVELGLTAPLDNTVFNGSKRWLGITVDPDPEMSPLQLLTSAPYAASSNNMGVAHKFPFQGYKAIPTSSASSAIDSVTIEISQPGVVLVFAQTNVYANHAAEIDNIYFQISSTRSSVDFGQGFGWLYLPAAAGTGRYAQCISVFKPFYEASAGTKKYYFNGYVTTGTSNTDEMWNLQLGATYFPMAIDAAKTMETFFSGNGGATSAPGTEK